MKLPFPKPQYNSAQESDRNRLIEKADQKNHKRGQDAFISPGRLLITSPDGTVYSIVVSDSGVVTAVVAGGF